MIIKIFLYLHIAAGTIGLILGPISMYLPKKRGLHSIIGKYYFYFMALVCLSSVPLSITHWEKNWWFIFVALFSFKFAWKGYQAAKNRKEDWLKKHISGMLGSYIAMVTALLVVNSGTLNNALNLPLFFCWILPTIIGTPLIRAVIRKHVQ